MLVPDLNYLQSHFRSISSRIRDPGSRTITCANLVGLSLVEAHLLDPGAPQVELVITVHRRETDIVIIL